MKSGGWSGNIPVVKCFLNLATHKGVAGHRIVLGLRDKRTKYQNYGPQRFHSVGKNKQTNL